MKFYNIDYLKSQTGISDYLRYILIFGSLIILVIVFSIYIKHRIKTKYRDLGIILFLFILLELGIQYSNYELNQHQHNQSSQMVSFIENLAKSKKIDKEKIFVNSTQFSDGILIKLDDNYYKVNLNTDQQSYTLTRSYLIDPENKELD